MSLQVEVLRESFRKVKPQADAFVESFYVNLFTDYPAAKPLFEHSDMKKQATMLKACLVMVVENLRRPGMLHEMLSGLGTRHVEYGALPEHYPLVGKSLLKTFEQYLKEDWTPEVKQAWVEAYTAITALMLEGADYPEDAISLEGPSHPASSPADAEQKAEHQPVGETFVSSPVQRQAKTPAEPLYTADSTAEKPTLAEQATEPLGIATIPTTTEENCADDDDEPPFPVLPVAGGLVGIGSLIALLLML